ncbi:MAG: helix-turn-helix transcriptional regulator [Lachnospiraceae bacterium]|nr:helix-turn-helix transcriptional regulator [Lachnospiraceae bacterium]
MAIFTMGEVIKRSRKALGITQEELADGICTPGGLSRIENGNREPSHAKFVALMQRLGQWDDSYDLFVGDAYFDIADLQNEIRNCITQRDFEKAQNLLSQYEEKIGKESVEGMYKQFLLLERLICVDQGVIKKEHIKDLQQILQITVPSYGQKKLHQLLLNNQEIMIINNMAIAYAENGMRSLAISMLQELDELLKDRFMNCRERMYLRAPILLNLIKYLGLEARYTEGLRLADNTIKELTAYGKTLFIPEIHFDIAWMLIQMDRTKYHQQILDEFLQSCYGRISQRQYVSARFVIDYLKQNVSELAHDVKVLHCEAVLCRQAELDYQQMDL